MLKGQQSNEEGKEQKKGELGAAVTPVPIIASARTGLAGKDDALLRKLPVDYSGKTVKQVLDYIVKETIKDSEQPLANSITKELNSAGSVVVVNGKTAKLEDSIEKYLAEKEHEASDGKVRKYRELEIEISAVQQGGYFHSWNSRKATK